MSSSADNSSANRGPRPLAGIGFSCDLAHEELGQLAALHWSVPDPVPAGLDAALDELGRRVRQLAPAWPPRTPSPTTPADRSVSPEAEFTEYMYQSWMRLVRRT